VSRARGAGRGKWADEGLCGAKKNNAAEPGVGFTPKDKKIVTKGGGKGGGAI